MYLKPEEIEVGKTNFNAAVGGLPTRRELLKGIVCAGAVSGAGLGSFYYGYDKSLGKPRLRIGVIGTGDEGNVLIGALNPEFHEVVAICDIRPYSIHRAFHGDLLSSSAEAKKARCGLMAKYGWKTRDQAEKHVKVYRDAKEFLEDKNIEAIVIGLPLHLHAPIAIEAMKRGKHVLTEKLMAKTITECKDMARVAKQTGMVLAVGHQRHYNVLYDNAKETIKQGLLGDIHHIRAQWHRGNLPGTDSWQMPLPPAAGDLGVKDNALVKKLASLQQKLEGLKNAKTIDPAKIKQIQEIQGQMEQVAEQVKDGAVAADKHGYVPVTLKDAADKVVYSGTPLEELIRWRLWQRTGGGLMVELGSHQLDAASIFIAAANDDVKQHPISVSAVAARSLFGYDREIEDHISCMIEFPGKGYDAKDPLGRQKKVTVTYSSINGNGFGGYGEIVFGTKGTLIIEREKEAMIFKNADKESKVGVKEDKGGLTLDTQASGGPAAAKAAAAVGPDVSRGYTEELEHWAWCIRHPDPKNKPHCTPEIAMGDAIIALTTNIAARNGLRIDFKEDWFHVEKDAAPETDPEILAKIKAANA